MDEFEDPVAQEEDGGLPGWVMTFADLMTLLMCFFVLMLAFSEMDAQKFKLLSGSMRDAFGVQAEIVAKTIPKGTSVIAREFSPSRPEATPLNEVRQFTTETSKSTLEFVDPDLIEQENSAEDRERAEADARKLIGALDEEIRDGTINVRVEGARIVIQILEKGSFPSGDADVEPAFTPVLRKMALLIAGMHGKVRIAGHTDDVPIATDRFRSNWELSAARAVSVAHALLESRDVDPVRLIVTGHADTRPRAPNDTPANRARNRRVDISIIRDSNAERRARDAATGEALAGSAAAEPTG